MPNKELLEVFFQEAEPDYGIPPVWCVKYLEEGKGSVDYSYHDTAEEAWEWVEEFRFIEH